MAPMSALGHKRTFCDAGAMSALPPGLYDFSRALGLHAVHQSSDRLYLSFRYFRGNTTSSAAIDGLWVPH